jgi:AcrR family transcriptional regulator
MLRYDPTVAARRETKPTKVKANPKPVPSSPDSPWQQRAVDRSINSARLRALARSSQFLAAAMELLEETGDVEFTVANIVERSNLSLRAFYQHFGSKDELLLSLFEELVTQFTDDLAAQLDDIDDPFDRLEAYVRGFLDRAHASRPFGGRAWTIYQMRLAADRPGDYAKSIARQVEVLTSIVEHGRERKAFRSDLPAMTMTLLINSTLVSMAQMDVFEIKSSGDPIEADQIWAWCRRAVTPDAASS